MPHATLTVPGFNDGRPLSLAGFAVATGLRRPGGGRSLRLADWSGQFALDDAALAQALAEHLERTFEEGHSGVAEIAATDAEGAVRFEGVAVRHRGGTNFVFDAFARVRL